MRRAFPRSPRGSGTLETVSDPVASASVRVPVPDRQPVAPPAPHGAFAWGWVAAGGAAGTAARAALTWTWPVVPGAFPWTVFAENVAGALALGAFLGWFARREGADGWRGPLLATGALGSFTTFSALAVDLSMLSGSRPTIAAVYAVASVGVGLAAAGLGWRWARGPRHGPLGRARRPRRGGRSIGRRGAA